MSTRARRIRACTRTEHEQQAAILNEIEGKLNQLSLLGAPHGVGFQDEILRIQGEIQRRLIDPLRQQWNESGLPAQEEPYQSVGYIYDPPRRPWAAWGGGVGLAS